MVVMDSRKRRDGAAIEELGWYNPIDISHSYNLKEDRILNWLKEGAQTTEAAHKLLRRAGIAHRWHLIKQGLEDSEVEKEMKKWKLNRENVLKDRAEKLKNKIKDKENVDASQKQENEKDKQDESPVTDVEVENDEEKVENNDMEEE